MKFSIVTISYNQARFLERALRSVLEQDYPELEYVVIDPGSTDGSRDIIERYRHRITRVIYEPDAGPADGLNKGFRQTTGELLGFLNSDDVLLPGALSRAAAVFRRRPEIDVVSAHARIIDEHDRTIRNGYSDRFSPFLYAYGAAVLMQQSTFFRRAIFERSAGFNTENRAAWDGELFLEFGLLGAKFALVNDFWSGYRLHETSITSSAKLDRQIREHQQASFRRVMGRGMDARDRPLWLALRIYKHLSNPRALYERLSKGPVYGYHARAGVR
jgi:glycosyltransferase involved in cell wall biosynthesis